uniref:Uncharacterized protein n=1 Tax=viral metagenome TaxID=1070528 RepID=A0A6M3KUY0_9ZZZZ
MIRNIDAQATILKGGTQGGQVGHRRNTTKGKVKYLHGIGCKIGGESCFVCPLPDCKWNA